MPAPRVRADYDQLAQIARIFLQSAQATQQSLKRLRSSMATLQGGDWQGVGARAFFREMDSDLLPAVQRLYGTLESAGRTTAEISRLVRQAEEEAARLLGAVGAAAAGVSAGAGGTAASGEARGSAGDWAESPAARPQEAGGAGGGAAPDPLAGFSQRTRDLARQSPTLRRQLEQLQRAGWTIVRGPAGRGSYADLDNSQLVIDSADSPEYAVGGLAHEAAHALRGDPPFHPPTEGMSRAEFIRINVQEHLRDEANAQFHELQARQEILDAGGPDIGVSGTQRARYERVYRDFRAGRVTREQAIDRVSNIVANDIPSGHNVTYRRYYSRDYEQYWRTEVAPRRRNR